MEKGRWTVGSGQYVEPWKTYDRDQIRERPQSQDVCACVLTRASGHVWSAGYQFSAAGTKSGLFRSKVSFLLQTWSRTQTR